MQSTATSDFTGPGDDDVMVRDVWRRKSVDRENRSLLVSNSRKKHCSSVKKTGILLNNEAFKHLRIFL